MRFKGKNEVTRSTEKVSSNPSAASGGGQDVISHFQSLTSAFEIDNVSVFS